MSLKSKKIWIVFDNETPLNPFFISAWLNPRGAESAAAKYCEESGVSQAVVEVEQVILKEYGEGEIG